METTLTKRILTGCVVKAFTQIQQNGHNQYLLTIKIEKTGHNLLIGGTVNINISGLNIFNFDYIKNDGNPQPITNIFNQQRLFTVKDASTLTCELEVNSSSFTNEAIVGGTPLVQINNDKITLKEGSYNFELINKTDYSLLRQWDTGYRLAFKEIGIGSAKVYNGSVDSYSDGSLSGVKDINEQDLTFSNCESVEIYIVDSALSPIPTNDYTKITNIGIIINKL